MRRRLSFLTWRAATDKISTVKWMLKSSWYGWLIYITDLSKLGCWIFLPFIENVLSIIQSYHFFGPPSSQLFSYTKKVRFASTVIIGIVIIIFKNFQCFCGDYHQRLMKGRSLHQEFTLNFPFRRFSPIQFPLHINRIDDNTLYSQNQSSKQMLLKIEWE